VVILQAMMSASVSKPLNSDPARRSRMAPVANLVAGAVLTGDHSLLWTPESSATLGAPGTELRVKRTSGGRWVGLALPRAQASLVARLRPAHAAALGAQDP
jgi:hypothetical protein